jgi:Zn-dependent protease with chaperone function
LVAFLAAFLIVAVATTAVITFAMRAYFENSELFVGGATWNDWMAAHLGLVGAIVGGTLASMVLASGWRAASLAGGGGQVARMLGATEVSGEGNDPLQRRLVNVVEEIALASGLPVPEIFVLEQEAAINAFASGLEHSNAAITVTRGALERLDRAELQGVIAHEFSHILNGDMRLNQQLIGLSFGILVLSLAGRWLLRSARFARRGRNNGGIAAVLAIGVGLTLIGAIGVLFSRIIKAAVSRQREALADASAVQFTREPQGLAGALKKIAGYTARLTSVETEEVAHMLFERGTRSFSRLFATHPPLIERIRTLDPTFDPRDLPPPVAGPPRTLTNVAAPASAQPIAPLAAGSAALLARAGSIEAPEVGGALRAALSEEIYHAARSRDASTLLIIALSLADDSDARARQLALLASQVGETRATHIAHLHDELQSVDRSLRLPILELSLPALKQRPGEQLAYWRELLAKVTALDPARPLFDFVLLRVLAAYFRSLGAPPEAKASAAPSRDEGRRAVRTLLANVAAFGHDDAAAARAAYAAGLRALDWPVLTDDPQFVPPRAARDLDCLEAALSTLGALRPRAQQRVLAAVLAVIRADGQVAGDEGELFRAIAASLDCPLPPGFTLGPAALPAGTAT